MGMAASQARLLALTGRIHDTEYQAQMIQSAKLQLATQEDAAYKKYNEALDATTLTFQDMQGNTIPANFNNLCGKASINNNIASLKNYVFRDKNDNLIIPSDIYQAFQKYDGNEAYGFAMFMMGCSNYESSLKKYTNNVSDEDFIAQIIDDINVLMNKLFKKSEIGSVNTSEDNNGRLNTMGEELIKFGWKEFKNRYFNSNVSDDTKTLLESLKDKYEEYMFKIFNKGDGAAEIYQDSGAGKKEDFDNDLFSYYLRWGKLIEAEGGIDFCTDASSYKETFESDAEILQGMIEAGLITIDTAALDPKTGKISTETTSVASDSNLAFTSNTQLDKKALAKAEAEYEHSMKEIDRKEKRMDMDLNRLETERNALKTEYDSVKKVIQDNVERTFGIFS